MRIIYEITDNDITNLSNSYSGFYEKMDKALDMAYGKEWLDSLPYDDQPSYDGQELYFVFPPSKVWGNSTEWQDMSMNFDEGELLSIEEISKKLRKTIKKS